MMAKKMIVCFIILMLTVYPASAGDVILDRWVLNITVGEDGIVEEIIQAEIENSALAPIEGISFFVPSSKVTMIYDFSHTYSSYGQTAEEMTVPGGTRINLLFNKSVNAGEKWSGRIGFTAENMAVKEGSEYSINMKIESPQAIVSGKNVVVSVPPDSDIRGQVFLPKSYEITSVQPEPFRNLFQYGHMVPTWTPEKLHIGDNIVIKYAYSDVLSKIVDNDDAARKLKEEIKKAKDSGKTVSEAETYLASANENNSKAFASFGGKDYSTASQYAGYSKDDLVRAENILAGGAVATPVETKKNPGFEIFLPGLAMLMIYYRMKRGFS